MKPTRAFVMMVLSVLLMPSPARPQEGALVTDVVSGMQAVPVPAVRMSGRVLEKDGVTPVREAELRLTNMLDGSLSTARSRKDGRYRLELPLGRYSLAIERRMEVFASPSRYTVPFGAPLTMDFLLLPDFETAGAAAPKTARDLPDPRPEQERVVGSVVDMAPTAKARKPWHWAETLGFLGTAIAVAIAGN